MAKNIVVCTDGTWDRPTSTDSGSNFAPEDTNVCKLFSLLPGDSQRRSATTRIKSVAGQVAFYDDGVGADGIWAVRVAEGRPGRASSSNCGMRINSSANNMKPVIGSTWSASAGEPSRRAVWAEC